MTAAIHRPVSIYVKWGRLLLQEGFYGRGIEVKPFCGPEGLMMNVGENHPIGAGKRNLEEAVTAIRKEGLELRAFNLRGKLRRRLFFNAETGEVLIKRFDKRRPQGGD